MSSCLLAFNLAVLVSTTLLEEDSINLLQTATHRRENLAQEVEEDKKKCVVKGDPHIKLWDTPDSEGAKVGLYGTYADYWLVNTAELKVMGRVAGLQKLDLSVVKGIAVSGSIVGDKILEVPSENNGPITFDGTPITNFPWEGGGMKITVGKGPNFNRFGGSKPMPLRKVTYTVTMDKAEIMFNQDVFQHLQIVADASLVAGDAGLCAHECKNWFECEEPICDLAESLFSTEHPQCGETITRVPCNKMRRKLAEQDCNLLYQGDSLARNAIQNCIEDCCTDRDQCPDRGEGDGQATCVVFGDPHVKGFDSSIPNSARFNPMGTHWLVNSEFIQVQARYVTDKEIMAGLRGIAVTGDIVGDVLPGGGHPVLYFPPTDGPDAEGGVDLDGKKLFDCNRRNCKTKDYKDPNGNYAITYGDAPDPELLLLDERPVPLRKHVFTVEFAHGAKFLIHQGAGQNMYMSIDSDLLYGVSGECGNFNGNPNDDVHAEDDNTTCATGNAIFLPKGSECQPADPNLVHCHDKNNLMKFQQPCVDHFKIKGAEESHIAQEVLKACMMDCCLGGACPGNNLDID